MTYQVIRKQPNSKMCMVCGLKNPFGLKTFFYELENKELLAVFTPRVEHQSYPGRMHGGIAATILDESIGRAIMAHSEGEIWGVTLEFTLRYKKPVPLGEELRVVSRVIKITSRIFEGTGEILLSDGTVAVEGRGKYMKATLDQIAEIDAGHLEWKVVPSERDFEQVEL
ncbi:MAG: PaaI family thioesterase [bacterium]|nr:PaaI family thioesterase [bacterium]